MKSPNMFQLRSRNSNITYGDEARSVINQRIQDYQEKTGKTFSSIKELFEALLSNALSDESTIQPKIEKQTSNDFTLLTFSNEDEFIEFTEEITSFRKKAMISDSLTDAEVLSGAMILAVKEPEIKEIEKEVIKTVPQELESNQILITLSNDKMGSAENKLIVLEEIQKRRNKKFKQLEPIPELCEKLIFNDNTIFNLGGEFYTGL